MISVMLLTVSLLTLGLLVVRSSVREVTQAGQLVARERALMSAQAAVDLAAAQYVSMTPAELNEALVGYNPQGPDCADPCGDCIPGRGDVVTGQRNEILAGDAPVACGGRPCMRQGAVAFLNDQTVTRSAWCDVPFRDLVPGGDPEARVTVWLRNNAGDALGANGSGDWEVDFDGRVVLTAMVEIRNTAVTVEQELVLGLGFGPQLRLPQTADEGYGGGHNNDNTSVSVCSDDYVQAEPSS